MKNEDSEQKAKDFTSGSQWKKLIKAKKKKQK